MANPPKYLFSCLSLSRILCVVTGNGNQTHFLGFEIWTAAELCSGGMSGQGFAYSAQALGSVTWR